jgi:hypothetical protein
MTAQLQLQKVAKATIESLYNIILDVISHKGTKSK